eukprot:365291-Chlamydomonas_euryale.AAC.8
MPCIHCQPIAVVVFCGQQREQFNVFKFKTVPLRHANRMPAIGNDSKSNSNKDGSALVRCAAAQTTIHGVFAHPAPSKGLRMTGCCEPDAQASMRC